MEPISEQKFSVTKPVNFDPSKRPRRQDLKVSIDNFSLSKIYFLFRVMLLKMGCSTSAGEIYWKKEDSRVGNVAMLKYLRNTPLKLIHHLTLHLLSKFCQKSIFSCLCDIMCFELRPLYNQY